ncbi:MAG: hypothetical protein AABX28_01610 [Nanoarchaeota archaeon]
MKKQKQGLQFNRKGDISVTILVLGVVVICSLALYSFYSSSIGVKKDFTGLSIIREINSVAEEIRFYKNPEINKNPEVMEIFNKEIIYKVGNSKIIFSGEKNSNAGRESYKITGSYMKPEKDFFFFGFGEEEDFYVEYEFES